MNPGTDNRPVVLAAIRAERRNIMEYEQALNIVKDSSSKAFLINGQDRKRLAISSCGSLMEMAPRSKRRGYILSLTTIQDIQSLVPIIPKIASMNHLERKAESLRKWKRYVEKNRFPSFLWTKLGEEANQITEEKLRKYISEGKADSSYDAWKACSDFGLPHIEGFKTITLATCRCPEWTIRRIAEAIEKKEDFNEHWENGYDYSCSGRTCEDGKYQAWLSQEFKGCGNGHYYLLISQKQAIFCEDD
jgi:hypothetical protein